MDLNKNIKLLNFWDLGLIKWTTFFVALWLVAVWPAFTEWIQSINHWWFLAIAIILAARPAYKYWFK